MSLDLINLGTSANDGTGDDLRAAGGKVNAAITKLNSGEFAAEVSYAGAELVSNTDFAANANGWTLHDSTWATGELDTAYNGSNDPSIKSPSINVVAGHVYLISFDQTISGDITGVYFAHGDGYFTVPASGTNKVAFVSSYTGNDEAVWFDLDAYNSGATRTLTRVSVREIDAVASPFSVIAYDGAAVVTLGADTANVALGKSALASNTLGVDNVAIGPRALAGNTTGSKNTALGQRSLEANTTGGDNVAIGQGALERNTTGSDNTAVGQGALKKNTTGIALVAVGDAALYENTTGSYNTGCGDAALQNNTTGQNNTACGTGAASVNTSGSGNVAVGQSAFVGNTTGNNLTVIGYLADVGSDGLSNAIAIGHGAIVSTSDAAQIGDASVTKLTVGVRDVALNGGLIIPPTSDPLVAGALWNNMGLLAISNGP